MAMSMTLFRAAARHRASTHREAYLQNRPRQRSNNRAHFLGNISASTQVVATVHPTRVEAKSLPEKMGAESCPFFGAMGLGQRMCTEHRIPVSGACSKYSLSARRASAWARQEMNPNKKSISASGIPLHMCTRMQSRQLRRFCQTTPYHGIQIVAFALFVHRASSI